MLTDNTEFFEIFPWNKNFETGIELIDEQHKQLVDILNHMAVHLANLSGDVTLNKVFDELTDYADYHFKTEESIWIAHFRDDVWYTTHVHTHDSFIDKLTVLKNNQELKPLDEVIQDIVSFLTHWLAFHILDTDRRMAKTVQAMDTGATLDEAKARANDEMNGSMKILVNTVLTMYDSLSMRTLNLMREMALRKQAEKALQLSEERWKFILDSGSENVWDWDIEKNEISHSENNIFVTDIVGKTISEAGEASNIHPDDIERVKADFHAHLNGKTDFYTNKHRVLRKNGSCSWVLSRGKVVSRDAEGRALRMVGTHSDVTERELASLIFKNSSQAMLISDADNNIISVNPAFCRITGYTEREVIGKNPRIVISGKHDKLFYQAMWEALNTEGHWSGEIWNKRKNGEIYPETLSINVIRSPDGKIDQYVALFSDISEKKKADETISKQANYDPLTQLQNRRMFNVKIEQEIQRSHRSDLPFALLFIDLDHFKEVNDSLGHEMGDVVLTETAHRIKKLIRKSDILSRFGGDEFTIILPDIKDTIGIDNTAQNIIRALSLPFQLDSNQVYVSASIGITLYTNDAGSASELLKNADQAMYQAKRSGRSRFNYFTPSMQESAQKRQRLLSDLHLALEMKQFQIYYQPIIDLKTGFIEKAEALIRWNHPEHGLIYPNDFIALAEQSGLIIEIGDWVFKEASRQTRVWKEKYHTEFKVSVNKSPVQFKSTSDINNWIDYLDELGLSGKNSVIEITENMLMECDSNIDAKLLQFRDAGIEIALDDFGTGYSSLSYLKKFDIDYIKIDQSFVKNLKQDSQDMAICKAVIVMAHALDIKVIAEGIETKSQCDHLIAMGCNFGQGYLFSRAVPAEEFEKLLEQIK
ncbi:EAL domain-containing protein [bacterium]|nr:EAL domain-containing protein [bacterium]